MELTKEEKEKLVSEIATCKVKLRETYSILCALRKEVKSYEAIYSRWHKRFVNADKELAEATKLIIVPTGRSGKTTNKRSKFTKEQISRLCKQLGVNEKGEKL